MRFLFCVMAAVLLIGCAPMIQPSNISDEKAIKDDQECTYLARQYALQMGTAGNVFLIGDEYRRCLRNRGWSG